MHDRKLTACVDGSGQNEPLEETVPLDQPSTLHAPARHDLVAQVALVAAKRLSPSIAAGSSSDNATLPVAELADVDLSKHDDRAPAQQDAPDFQSIANPAVTLAGDKTYFAPSRSVAAEAFPFAAWTNLPGALLPEPETPHKPLPTTEPPSAETRPSELKPYVNESSPSDAVQLESRAGLEAAESAVQSTAEPDNQEALNDGAAPRLKNRPAIEPETQPDTKSGPQSDGWHEDDKAECAVPRNPSYYAAPETAELSEVNQPPTLAVPDARPAPPAKRRNALRMLATAARFMAIALAVWFAAMVLLIVLFRFVNPPTSALILLRTVQGMSIDQRWVPLDKISPGLVHAVITSEDGRFCSHWGIDPREVAAAISRSARGKPRGASTMTMQLAKNLFLWPQQSYVRKALEVPLTLTIDALWPKSRIAEVYLNIVEWGPGIFGAEAATRRHFKRSAQKLTTHQAALLAVALPSPIHRKPGSPSRLMNKMASTIMARMRTGPAADDCVVKPR